VIEAIPSPTGKRLRMKVYDEKILLKTLLCCVSDIFILEIGPSIL